MRILYGINTNGQGHINRARNLIHQMNNDGHELDIFFSGPKPPTYAFDLSPNYRCLKGMQMAYQDHLVNVPKTIWINIQEGANLLYNIRKMQDKLRERDYSAIIVDMDPYSSIYGMRENIPTITVDHQHSLFHPNAYNPNRHLLDKISAHMAIRGTALYRNFSFSLDYTDKALQQGNNVLFPLIRKVDMEKNNYDEEDFILMYFNKSSLKQVTKLLLKFPETKFKVYGFGRDKQVKNIKFAPTGRKTFVEDLMKAKGVVASAGFSLTWECIQLDKPMYLIPQKFQYEQYVNARRLKRLNYAVYSLSLSEDRMREFLSEFIPSFRHKNDICK